MKKLSAVLLFLVLLTGNLRGDIVTVEFTSSHLISGDIAGTLFSSSDWSIRFNLDDTATDTDLDIGRGYFENLVLSGEIRIDGSTYEIAGSNFTNTQALLYDYSKTGGNLNVIAVYMDAGGIGYAGSNNFAFPSTFLDNNILATAINGTTSLNSDSNDPGYAGDFSFADLLTTSGDVINVDYTDLGVGTTSVSSLTGVIPEPNVSGLVSLSLFLLAMRRRRIA